MHVFALLADPVRRLLVETLATGEHSVAELTDMAMHDFGIGRTAVSHHLRILRDEHVAITRQDAGSRMYRLHPGAIDRIERELGRGGWPAAAGGSPRLLSPAVARERDAMVRVGRGGDHFLPPVSVPPHSEAELTPAAEKGTPRPQRPAPRFGSFRVRGFARTPPVDCRDNGRPSV